MLATSTLANGVNLASQFLRSELSTLTLAVKAGTRDEVLGKSGTAHLIEHLRYSANHSVTNKRFIKSLSELGLGVTSHTDREISYLTLQVMKGRERDAVQVAADMMLNFKFSQSQLQFEQDSIKQEIDGGDGDQRDQVLDLAHEAAFEAHKLGKSVLGNDLSLLNVTTEDCEKFIKEFYVGPNIALVTTGNFDHQSLTDIAQSTLGGLPSNESVRPNANTPVFSGSYLELVQDSDKSHLGVFFPAPGYNHKDFLAFKLLQSMMSSYEPSRDAFVDMSKTKHNSLHKFLGKMFDLTHHESLYFPYSDCGLMGHYAVCSDVGAYLALVTFVRTMQMASKTIDSQELLRAKQTLISQLTALESGADKTKYWAKQLLYNKSIQTSTFVSEAVEALSADSLTKIYSEWVPNSIALAHMGTSQSKLHTISKSVLNC